MSLMRNIASVATTQAVLAPLGLLVQIVLARWLSAADRGAYAVATEFVVLAVVFANLGLPAAAIFRLRRTGSRADAVAAALLSAGAILSVLVCAPVAMYVGPLGRRLGGADFDPMVLWIAASSLPFQLFGQLLAGLARGLDRFDLHNAYQGSSVVLTLLLLVAVLGPFSVGARGAVGAYAGANALATLLLAVPVLRRTGLSRYRGEELVQMLGYGSRTHVHNVLANVHQRVDVLLLGWLTSRPAEVAVYAVAVAVVNRIRLVPSAIALASFPEMASRPDAEAAGLTAQVLRHSVLWVAASVIATALLAPLLLPLLFGETYEASVAPLLILLPGTAFLTVQMVVGRYFASMDRLGVTIASQLTGTVLNLVLNLLWIPTLGARGAALASLVSYTVQGLVILVLFRIVSGRPLRSALVVEPAELRGYVRQAGRIVDRLRGRGPS